MTDFTFQDFVNFSKKEKEMVEKVLPALQSEDEMGPSEETLRFLTDYSKALSVRQTKKLNRISIILN